MVHKMARRRHDYSGQHFWSCGAFAIFVLVRYVAVIFVLWALLEFKAEQEIGSLYEI